MLRRPGRGRDDHAITGELRGGQQRLAVAAEDRHRPRTGARHPDEHATRAAEHVRAAHVSQLARDHPRASAQADQRARAQPLAAVLRHAASRRYPSICASEYGRFARSRSSGTGDGSG